MSLALEPQHLTGQSQDRNSAPEPMPGGLILAPALGRFWRLFRLSIWRAFEHDAFGTAKASAYSSIFTFFPALLVLGSVVATLNRGEVYLREISYALGTILPAGSSTALSYLRGSTDRPVGLLISTSLFTVWSASGVIISWMDGFRRAYQLPKTWGIVQERLIAFSLVLMAGIPMTFSTVLVAFGSRIEMRILFLIGHEFGPLILLLWGAIRWAIAIMTSVAVIQLIYHNAVPRTQPWHTVLPGAVLATAMWLISTALFGWYLQHYADYSVIYGSLGVGIALLVWMYLISLAVLIGAEFNAMLFPRCVTKVPPPRVDTEAH
ncbi:MAG TPA: YihY/virulence factor BrkB family protein [Terriglobales bacterium]|jgi:membrane protein|nr:YihY/virulence factor BrkB family protein [Terriglobales bacterium]